MTVDHIIVRREYYCFNDMSAREMIKRAVKLPIVEPTERSIERDWYFEYSKNVRKFMDTVYRLWLVDELSGINPKYELNKFKRNWIDSLSIYEMLVLISTCVTQSKFFEWIITDRVENWNIKAMVLKIKELASKIDKSNINTPEWARIIYWIKKDIRRFKPLFAKLWDFTYAKTMPDIPHFYKVIWSKVDEEDEENLVLYDRFKFYLKYFWKDLILGKKKCRMFEYGNYYYRMNENLIYRIPTDLETFKRDMKKVKVEHNLN